MTVSAPLVSRLFNSAEFKNKGIEENSKGQKTSNELYLNLFNLLVQFLYDNNFVTTVRPKSCSQNNRSIVLNNE